MAGAKSPPARKRVKQTNKKQRVSAIADSEDEAQDVKPTVNDLSEDEGDEEQEETEKMPAVQVDSLTRHSDNYVTGSIVRIAAHNFVTYDNVELRPGPYLNMVLGPNGTGKSTLACAIVIGLGFPPKVLGRASKISEYVKTGAEEGWVEIELKGTQSGKNVVVRRTLNSTNDKSIYYLNGQQTSAANLQTTLASLRVQVNNQCTFLPQDQVANFARMGPTELLKETQRAAGHPKLTEWYEKLVNQHSERTVLEEALDYKVKRLQTLTKRHEEDDHQIQAFNRRQELKEQIEFYDLILPHIEFKETRDHWLAAKRERTLYHNQLEKQKAEMIPFENTQKSLKIRIGELAEEKRSISSKINKTNKAIHLHQKEIQNVVSSVESTRSALESLVQNERLRAKRIETLKREGKALQQKMGPEPATPDLGRFDAQIVEKNREIEQTQQEKIDYNQKIRHIHDSISREVDRIKEAKQSLERVLNIQNLRLDKCKADDLDTYRAIQWYENNRDKFKGRVFLPPKITLSLRPLNGKTYQALAEGPISRAAFRTFLFELTEDMDTMMHILHDSGTFEDSYQGSKLRINCSTLGRWRTLEDVRYPMERRDMQALGFDCWAVELIDGPQEVLAHLCDDQNLSKIPIAFNPRTINVEAVEESRAISRYYSPDGSTSIKYSAYGNKTALTESRALERPKNLNVQVDPHQETRLRDELKSIEAGIPAMKHEKERLAAQLSELNEKIKAIEHERRAVQEAKRDAQQPLREWKKANETLRLNKDQLAAEQRKPDMSHQKEKLTQEMSSCVEQRFKLVEKIMRFDSELQKHEIRSSNVSMRLIHLENDLAAMLNSSDDKVQTLQDLEESYARAARTVIEFKRKSDDIQRKTLQMTNEVSQEVLARVAADPKDKTIEEYRRLIDEVNEELSGIHAVSNEIIHQYEKRQLEMEELAKVVCEDQEKLNSQIKRIKKVEQNYLPHLESLRDSVSKKFSEAFDRMGCIGEVEIDKPDANDYSTWGIQIKVAFRDGEELVPLDSHRQSGGERAVSTITYLLSLAELAQAPFGLVDEINQGMDQRNERIIHNSLVQTTCKDDVGQYFLITPKLLTDLEYHPKMRVLVINNGDWIPSKLSLKKIVALKMEKQRRILAH